MMHCCQQDIMASVKIASSATRATDHSLYFKFIKVTMCTVRGVPCLYGTYRYTICKQSNSHFNG
jgi:hypothetical protein